MHQYFTDNSLETSNFKQLLSAPKKILITSHQNPDGDAFGSSLAMYLLLTKMGHHCTVISPTDHAAYIAWLPGVDKIINFQNSLNQAEAIELIEHADIHFLLDFSSAGRIADMEEYVFKSSSTKVMIDHHQMPEQLAEYVFWDDQAAATCELIFQFIEKLGLSSYVDKDIATCLYTGILTDTGSFKFESTTKEIHRIAGELLDYGINPNDISRRLFDQNSIDRMRFLGYALGEKLTYLPEYNVVYFKFSEEELVKYNSRKGDTEGVVNYGLSVAGVVMSVIFIEREGKIKLSLRSVDDFSVAELSRDHFNGGGHKNAAGGISSDTLENTVNKFLALLPLYKTKLLNLK